MRLAALFALPLLLAAPPTAVAPAADPAAVLDRELAAYNARSMDAFLAFYTPDAKRYEPRFAEPNLHATIVSRMVIGDKVIDRENIVRTFPEGTGTWDVVAISEVKGGLISRVWFMIGAKRLDKQQ